MGSTNQAGSRLRERFAVLNPCAVSTSTGRQSDGARVMCRFALNSLPRPSAAGGVLFTLYSPVAGAASSASFQIPASTFDIAGGSASSASHQIVSCVGSEIAGTSGSTNFRVDSGCGVTLGFVTSPLALPEAFPVPALSATTAILLTVILGAFALLQVRRRMVGTITSST